MLFFSQRRRLTMQFEAWCKENGVLNSPLSMVGFLQSQCLLDEEKVREYLNALKEEKTE